VTINSCMSYRPVIGVALTVLSLLMGCGGDRAVLRSIEEVPTPAKGESGQPNLA
jgi:hypothetical protein